MELYSLMQKERSFAWKDIKAYYCTTAQAWMVGER